MELAEGIYSLDYGIALPNQPNVETKPYSRSYIWNEKNQLKTSVENGFVVNYRYGEDGQRAVKSSAQGETLYFNNMWQMSTTPMGMRQTKHIFVGETRIATKNNWWKDSGTEYERYNTYYFHSDHLGSAQLITDWRGEEYERIEYTPYGELWIEKVRDGFETINYRFTGKEMDSETGLYYFGARYLDPKYSRWLSTDPALGDYVPQAPVNDEARKANGNLPGQGGLFNQVNFHLYHYAGNNPILYVDPDGKKLYVSGTKAYMAAVQKELSKLCYGAIINFDTGAVTLSSYSKSVNPKGAELLSSLIESSQINTISIGNSISKKGNSCVGYTSDLSLKDGKYYGNVSDGPKNSLINFNPDNWNGGYDDGGSKYRPPFVGLAHEMGHSEAINNGTQTYEEYVEIPGTTPNSEKNSIKWENLIRKEHNLTPRSNYFYKPKDSLEDK